MATTLKQRMEEAAADMGERFNRADLQNACGVTKASVSDWFTGKTKSLKGDTLVAAAAYFGVSASWLGDGKGQKREPLMASTPEEVELLSLFRKMDAQHQVATLGVARMGRMLSYPVDPPIKPAPTRQLHEAQGRYRPHK